MENEQTTLEARTEVADTVTRLFVNIDEGNWEGLAGYFAPKVLFDLSSLTGSRPTRVGPKRTVEHLESGVRGLAAVHHQLGNMLVNVEGAEASAFCYVTATHYLPNPTRNDVRRLVGTYDLHLVRGEDDWKVDALRFNLKFTEGNLLPASLAKKASGRD